MLRKVATEAAVIRAADGESALAAAAAGGVSIAAANACGTIDYPIPADTPTRYNVTAANIETYFRNQGFHPTEKYACGLAPALGQCPKDWTKSRSFASALGTCAAPAFRNQGVETNDALTTGWMQYGEPNPEILGYTWPYWNWGSYVEWWHQTY